jgi:hypothetical protein
LRDRFLSAEGATGFEAWAEAQGRPRNGQKYRLSVEGVVGKKVREAVARFGPIKKMRVTYTHKYFML